MIITDIFKEAKDKILAIKSTPMDGNPLFPIVSGDMIVVRDMGIDSSTKFINVTGDGLEESNSVVSIYNGEENYKNFDVRDNIESELEILLTFTPSSQVEVSVNFNKDEYEDEDSLSVSLFIDGVLDYSVKGKLSEMVNTPDRRIMQIRIKEEKEGESIFNTDFSHKKSFIGLAEDRGDVNREVILFVANMVAWDASYIITNGQTNPTIISVLDEVAKVNLVQFIVDIPKRNVADGVKYIDSLNLKSNHDRLLDRRDNPRGYSLDFARKSIARDTSIRGSKIKQKALYAIVGVSNPIDGQIDGDYLYFTLADYKALAKNKIVYITTRNGVIFYGDSFGMEQDIEMYIEKSLSEILSDQQGQNPIIASLEVNKKAKLFLDACENGGFFKKRESFRVENSSGELTIRFGSRIITGEKR